MKKYILPIFYICIIAFSFLSCAEKPLCESSPLNPDNHIFLGIYHGLVLPFAIVGKLLGFDIGIYSITTSHFSYWLGFLISLIAYAKVFTAAGKTQKT